ncbi:MAG: protease HtpX [Peptococcaceae bacterium BICA1-7]|nr:MAG: protease HtpX [Peptococcaceae bacterium BICA1-7]HBV97954.1 protease HtpX [Desulfotomaculum sp.]
MNTMKVWLLMGGLTVLLVLMGNAINGSSGMIVFFMIAVAMNFFSYFYSDKIAIKMTRSYPVSEAEAPDLYEIVRRLSQRAGIPMPRLYVTPSDQPNAFATGRNPSNSAVAVTEGIMRLLTRSEVEGVLAHELAHIKNRDVLVGTVAATMAGAISMIGNVIQWGAIFGLGRGDDEEGGSSMVGALIMAILFPIAAMIIQLAISRSREYGADATGAQIAGSTDGLANALLKLESAAHRIPMRVNPSTSHLFIVNPLSGASMARLFSTHPPIQERVEKLRAMRIR